MKAFFAVQILTLSATFLVLFASPAGARLISGHDTGNHLAIKTTVSNLAKNLAFRSQSKQEINIWRFPSTKASEDSTFPIYKFYIQGGLHGDERLTSDFVRWMVDRMAKGTSLLNLIPSNQASFDFVPIANPDGYSDTSRLNANRVNLNRNFKVFWGISKENPGSTAFSESETKSIKYLFETEKYTAAVDVHGFINWIVAPSLQKGRDDATYHQWMSSIQKEMKQLGNYELKTGLELGDGGAFEDWAFWENGTFALCLEMASPYRFGSNILQDSSPNSSRDQFEIYERFIYQMFLKAIELKKPDVQITQK